MPIMNFKCDECGTITEKLYLKEPPADSTMRCSECGSVMKKMLCAPSLHFSGSGFYATDYAKPIKAEVDVTQ